MASRDELWKASWDTFYDAYYYQILFSELSKKWQKFDFITRLLVALTAPTSAVAGWALWNDDEFKVYWVVFAGLSSLVSILHSTSNTGEKLKQYAKLSNDISNVRIKFEALRHELSIFPDFDVEDNFDKYQNLRDMYHQAIAAHTPDFMTTSKIENKSQDILNKKLNV